MEDRYWVEISPSNKMAKIYDKQYKNGETYRWMIGSADASAYVENKLNELKTGYQCDRCYGINQVCHCDD